MKAIINGRIVLKDRIVEGKVLVFDEKITGIYDQAPDCEIIDAKGGFVTPGLIDVHTHGYLGYDCTDGEFEGLTRMAEGIAKNGVTSFLATTMTASYEDIEKAFSVTAEYMAKPSEKDSGYAKLSGMG